ncbi:MAG: type III-A CRISPR-associated RAMP protein Csm4 [Candidatus Tectimicrobiota bacterium]|nr:MAG: type III-A CRISPR-associated RAMP protein Csm4 [Candidatus Tectomicrobia bacterium]
MAEFVTYRLHFRAPLHIGERGVGLEATRTHVPADTLFSALCMAWRTLYGVEALEQDVLDWFTEAEAGSEPFLLSSAFPYAGEVRLFPKPLARLGHLEAEDEKAFKRVRWVSERVFAALVSGEALRFEKKHCLNGGTVWVSEVEKAALAPWTDDATEDIVLWKEAVVPRVTLDRLTQASEIWHFGEVRFAPGVGLWFAVDFNQDHGDGLRQRFEACLRLLGDSGLGGERGAGRGLFELEPVREEPLPEAEAASHFVTLSPLCPRREELAILLAEGAAYELMPRRGWVTSPEAANLRRQMVWMFAEGSLFPRPEGMRLGRLVSVKPERCPHAVWRYGYAFPVGVKK